MHNTLILLTVDETGTGNIRNTVFALLLGDALPPGSAGTTDSTFYTHYSQISTIEWNWNLHTLGRWDVGANVFSFAVEENGGSVTDTCDLPKAWTPPPPFSQMEFDSSYFGPLNSKNQKSKNPWPAPDVDAVKCGRTVLPSIVDTWKNDRRILIIQMAILWIFQMESTLQHSVTSRRSSGTNHVAMLSKMSSQKVNKMSSQKVNKM